MRIRDVALVQPTSGTTSIPKGCMLTHEAYVGPGVEMAGPRFRLAPHDRFWCALPLFHLGGLITLIGCLSAGATWVGLRYFNPDAALAQLERERCVIAYPIFDTLWLPIVDHPRFDPGRLNLREVHAVGPYERLVHYQSAHPDAVLTGSYGMSEFTPATCTTPDDSLEVRLNTAGRATPGTEIRIVDPASGEVSPPLVAGDIQYRGWRMFEGYLGDDAASAATVDSQGWISSGDLGFLDRDGYLHYVGRIKDTLKVGGENVAAAEIETLLMTLTGVGIVHVVGAPDPKYAEVPAAYIEVTEQAQLSERDVIDWCKGRIAEFKIPRYVRFVDSSEWPMSATKVQKARLREWIAAELAPPESA